MLIFNEHFVTVGLGKSHNPELIDFKVISYFNQGSYASWKPLKTLEFQKSDFKALKVLDFLLKKIEKY